MPRKTKRQNFRKVKTRKMKRGKKTRKGGMFRNAIKRVGTATTDVLYEIGKDQVQKFPEQKDFYSKYEKGLKVKNIKHKYTPELLSKKYEYSENNENDENKENIFINPNINPNMKPNMSNVNNYTLPQFDL